MRDDNTEGVGREQTAIPVADRAEFPLCVNQREMWAQCQLHGGRPLSNLAVEVALTGPLDAARFQRAFQAAIDRHDALRTSFPAPEGSPVQRVTPVLAAVPVYEARRVEPDAQAACVRARAEALLREPFVLDRAPLFRVELLRFSPDRAVCVFAFHHLILDGFHLSRLLDDFAVIYERDDPAALPPPSGHYGAFAIRQEAALDAGLLARDRLFWQTQLHAPLPPMAIPWDRQPASARTFENGALTRRLSGPVVRAVASLKVRAGTTTFRIVSAALQVLLWRLTDQADLMLAMPFSVRPDDLADVAGFFGNTLPIRTTLDPDQPFERLIADLTARIDGARAHSGFPLADALRTLDLQRDPNRPALPICISQVRGFARDAGDLHLRAGLPLARHTMFDLWLMVASGEDGLELVWHYAAELFDAETIAAMADALERLLLHVAEDPAQAVREIDLLGPDERRRAIGWGDGGTSAPPPTDEGGREMSLVDELAAVCARAPLAPAVTDAHGTWTYAELHEAGDRIARALRAADVGREARVGLLGARGRGMLAAVLGVVTRGAAFVPLEASQPEVRLQAIARAAGLAVLMADRDALARAESLVTGLEPPVRVLCWTDIIEAGGTPPSSAIETRDAASDGRGPADLAYIFHTSGSSGVPKGVMVEQGAMRNHLRAKIATLSLDASSRVVQNASYGFDIIVWQWLAPLLVGGQVLVYDDLTADHPPALLEALARDGATILETVPSALEALIEATERLRPAAALPRLPALRWLVSNAEALPPAVARRWHACYPDVRLLNTYGATECADDVTHGEVRAARSDAAARVAVGQAIAGATVAVVDEWLRPLPPGCAGEIVLGGVAVGRGYLGDPAATAVAFVPDPRGAAPGARLYRTGDRGRWRADGTLDCLGRQDDQLKLHGYRVELGEVEAALAAVPGLSQVAAAVRVDARGRRRLVAYYAAAAPSDAALLRKALAARLPAYMVPDAWIWLTALPRTRTGKLDRRALPAPLADAPGRSEPPATPLEALVADVWRDVLQVSSVGRDDNFFDLGGDSMQSIQVAARLAARGYRLSARDLFTHQTVEELAQAVTAR